MRILFYNRRQHIKEKEFQVMFASDAPKRLKKFSGHAVSAGEILFSILHCDYCSLCLDSSQRTSKERLLVKIGYQPCPLQRSPGEESKHPSAHHTAIIRTVTPQRCLLTTMRE